MAIWEDYEPKGTALVKAALGFPENEGLWLNPSDDVCARRWG
jgi:hypothetical protein